MGEFYDYRPEEPPSEYNLSVVEKAIIKTVVDMYGGQDTEDLVDQVYEEFDIEEKPKYSKIL